MDKTCYSIVLIILFLVGSCTDREDRGNKEVFNREDFLNINGDSIFYKILGKGDPILFIHGGPGLDHSYLLPQMAGLSEHFQLIFYDQRACGRSSYNVDTTSISISGFMNDIEELRKELNIEKLTILGHSWGSLLAMNYGIQHAQNIKKMILVNPVSPDSEYREKEQEILISRMTTEDSLAQAHIMDSEALKNHESEAYENLFRVLYRKQFYNRDLADSLTLSFPKNFYQRSQILQHLGKDFSSYNLYDDLQQFDFPVLIIYGDYDPLAHEVGPKLQSTIAQSQLRILKNCGHFPYIEKNEEFFREVTQFLD